MIAVRWVRMVVPRRLLSTTPAATGAPTAGGAPAAPTGLRAWFRRGAPKDGKATKGVLLKAFGAATAVQLAVSFVVIGAEVALETVRPYAGA